MIDLFLNVIKTHNNARLTRTNDDQTSMKTILIRQLLTAVILLLLVIFSTRASSGEEYNALGIHFPPLMYEQGGKPAGFYYDLLQLILQRMEKVTINSHFYPTPRMFRVLQNTPNTFALGIARIPERESLYKWIGPSIQTKMGLYKLKNRADIRIESVTDIKQYRIGTCRAYAFVDMLKRMGVPEAQIQVVNLDVQNVNKLHLKRIDLMATLDIVLADVVKQTARSWNEFEIVFEMGRSDMHYAFNKLTDDSFITTFGEALSEIKKTKAYSELINSYLPQ